MIPTQGVDAQALGDDPELCEVLASLKYFKAGYKRQDKPEGYLYRTLALNQQTSEKQAASAMDLVATFGEAARLKRAAGLSGKALRDIVALCIGDYNRQVSKAGL